MLAAHLTRFARQRPDRRYAISTAANKHIAPALSTLLRAVMANTSMGLATEPFGTPISQMHHEDVQGHPLQGVLDQLMNSIRGNEPEAIGPYADMVQEHGVYRPRHMVNDPGRVVGDLSQLYQMLRQSDLHHPLISAMEDMDGALGESHRQQTSSSLYNLPHTAGMPSVFVRAAGINSGRPNTEIYHAAGQSLTGHLHRLLRLHDLLLPHGHLEHIQPALSEVRNQIGNTLIGRLHTGGLPRLVRGEVSPEEYANLRAPQR